MNRAKLCRLERNATRALGNFNTLSDVPAPMVALLDEVSSMRGEARRGDDLARGYSFDTTVS